MQHPVLSYRANTIYYFLIWGLVAATHIFIIDLYTSFGIEYAVVDAVVSDMSMAIIGLGMWYLVRFSDPKILQNKTLFANLILGGAVLLSLWMFFTNFTIYRILGKESSVFVFLSQSTIMRTVVGLFLYLILLAFYYLHNYYRILGEKMASEAALQRNIKETELAYLRSQVNPHFLFNALNSISSLTLAHPEKAQESVIGLSKYLRSAMYMSNKRFATIDEELENIYLLLQIEKIRYGERLNYQIEIKEGCNQKTIPALLLQPVFENAIKYGLHESTEPVLVEAKIWCESDYVNVTVSNNYEEISRTAPGTGKGLQNIRQRLELVYDQTSRMDITDDNNVFTVTLKIPQFIEVSLD